MSYILSSTIVRAPNEISESNSTQVAVNRVLSGGIRRDYFGSNKRVWTLEYENTKSTDYSTIKAIYDTYLSTNTAVTWEITETNYVVAQTSVHVDLEERSFKIKGTDYLSDFTLVLTEV